MHSMSEPPTTEHLWPEGVRRASPRPAVLHPRFWAGVVAEGLMGAVIGWAVCQADNRAFGSGLASTPDDLYLTVALSGSLALGSAACSAFFLHLRQPASRLMAWLVSPLLWGVMCALAGALIAALPTLLVGTIITVPFALNLLVLPAPPWVPFLLLLLAPLCAAGVRAAAGLPGLPGGKTRA
jgi:hypothetical protein